MSIWDEPLVDDIWLVGVSGRLDQRQTADLEAIFNKLIDDEHVNFIVDLAEVTYINSGGLRCLVSVWRQVRRINGDVILCDLNPRISEVFNIVGFDKIFQIHSDRESALKSFQKGSHSGSLS